MHLEQYPAAQKNLHRAATLLPEEVTSTWHCENLTGGQAMQAPLLRCITQAQAAAAMVRARHAIGYTGRALGRAGATGDVLGSGQRAG